MSQQTVTVVNGTVRSVVMRPDRVRRCRLPAPDVLWPWVYWPERAWTRSWRILGEATRWPDSARRQRAWSAGSGRIPGSAALPSLPSVWGSRFLLRDVGGAFLR